MAEVPFDAVRVGHWSDTAARTGCTVVRFDAPNVASGEVRGGAPATREFALLDPRRSVESVDAVVLSGGSAYGLDSCSGVAAALEEQGAGFATRDGVVPIVVGMCLYDLGVGDASVRPGFESGAEALAAASPVFDVGRVGAGAGATIGKWRGVEAARAGGLGWATVELEGLTVAALMAVNAAGDLSSERQGLSTVDEVVAGHFDWPTSGGLPAENTTIGVVVTNGRFSKVECRKLAEAGHDGIARAIVPAHGPFDGDALVVVSCPGAAGTAAAHAADADAAAADAARAGGFARARLMVTAAVQNAIASVSTDPGDRSS